MLLPAIIVPLGKFHQFFPIIPCSLHIEWPPAESRSGCFTAILKTNGTAVILTCRKHKFVAVNIASRNLSMTTARDRLVHYQFKKRWPTAMAESRVSRHQKTWYLSAHSLGMKRNMVEFVITLHQARQSISVGFGRAVRNATTGRLQFLENEKSLQVMTQIVAQCNLSPGTGKRRFESVRPLLSFRFM